MTVIAAISVSEIADALGPHPKYLMGLFRRLSGMTLLDYIAQQRVAYAQRLLATESSKVNTTSLLGALSGAVQTCAFSTIRADKSG